MKRESRTVDRSHEVDSPTQRHLPLVDLLVDTPAELMELAVSLSLIRSRGHLPRGGYDVQNGIKQHEAAGTAAVHRGVQSRGGTAGPG